MLTEATVYSVQAVVISTEVAHNLGHTQLNALLSGAAIRIAQCLGMHKIRPTTDTLVNDPQCDSELRDMELGKRIWCQMLVQDLFAIPFNDSYGTRIPIPIAQPELTDYKASTRGTTLQICL